MKITLEAKNRLAFLEGKHPKPTEGADEIQKWTKCDYMVRSWLFANMKPEIASGINSIQSAREVRVELTERYGQTNAPQLYQLKKELWEFNGTLYPLVITICS